MQPQGKSAGRLPTRAAERPSVSKIKKTTTPEALTVRFVPNVDILAAVAALPAGPFCVGFAAESEQLIEHARAKLVAKKLPLVIANRAQDAIGADDSELTLVDARSAVTLPRASKLEQARRIIAAFDLPENKGKGVVQIDGRMVERMHADIARRTVAIAEAIEKARTS